MDIVRIFDKSVSSVLSALRETGVRGVSAGDGYVDVRVERKDLEKAIAICSERCYNYKITGTVFGSAVKKALGGLPLIIASVVMAAFVFISNAFVWRVEIAGADGAAELRLRSVLANMGVGPGMLKSSLDRHSLERALTDTEFVSAASVSSDGSVLKVDVLLADTDSGTAGGGAALVSNQDCVITRIVADCGTPTVGPGDAVRRGDVLIEGKEYNTADGSESGTVAARGRAYGRVTFSYSAPVADGMLRRTGNSSVTVSVGMCGLTLGDMSCPFGMCESETTYETLQPLPVRVVRTTHYELAADSFDDTAARFAEEKADELFEIYGVRFDKRVAVADRGGTDIMTIYFTAEICVGEI